MTTWRTGDRRDFWWRALWGLTLVLSAGPALRLSAQTQPADSAWAGGDFKRAKQGYELVLHDDPGNVRALYRLAVLASWRGDIDSALAMLRDAREREPDDPDVRIYQAKALSWDGRLKRAVIQYDSCIALFPERRDARFGRAQTLAWAGRFKESEEAFDALAAEDSGDLDALAGRAQVAAWRGDLTEAVDRYELALSKNPNHLPSLIGLAQVRYWEGRPREARQLTDRALAVEPTDRDAHDVEAKVRAAIRPELDLALGWSRDSDRNQSWWQSIASGVSLAEGLRTFGTIGALEVTDPVRNGHRLWFEAGAGWTHGNTNITAALGGRRLDTDSSPSRSVGTWRASFSQRVAPGAGIGLGYAHYSFDETALLAGRDLDIDEINADADAEVSPGLTLAAGGGLAWLSDNNNRHSAVMAVTQRIANRFTVGAYGRWMGYDTKVFGYFSPDRFLVGEGRGSYTWTVRKWEAKVSGGLGVQQVTRDGRAQSEWHVEGHVTRRWAAINEASAFAGVSSSAESSTTGAFRWYTAGVTVRLGL